MKKFKVMFVAGGPFPEEIKALRYETKDNVLRFFIPDKEAIEKNKAWVEKQQTEYARKVEAYNIAKKSKPYAIYIPYPEPYHLIMGWGKAGEEKEYPIVYPLSQIHSIETTEVEVFKQFGEL